MADSNIGALPQAPSIADDSLLVMEQQGQAMKITGAQFKEFGRQAVIGQMQGYVDQAQEAAERAEGAVEPVTSMTVEAHASQAASVTKTMLSGKVHLSFGLPGENRGCLENRVPGEKLALRVRQVPPAPKENRARLGRMDRASHLAARRGRS